MANAIDDLIEYFGNTSDTAHALKVDRQLVDGWVKQGYIPFARGEEIEAVTEGKVTASHVWICASKARHH